jgi:hypothetical protein
MSPRGAFIIVATLAAASPAAAQQAGTGLWSDLTLEWIKSHTWTLKVDVEPKVLVSKPPDQPGWTTLDVTPAIEFTRSRWVDLVGELLIARTHQTDDLNTVEVTPRAGVRIHFLSNVIDDFLKEKQPKRRLAVDTLLRVEWRNLFYSDNTPQSSTGRIRDRIDLQFPLNRPKVTSPGTVYTTADAEWFWPIGHPKERFANKQRVRAGLGYRLSYAWRFETMYVWDRSRDSAENGFTLADRALYVRVRRVW